MNSSLLTTLSLMIGMVIVGIAIHQVGLVKIRQHIVATQNIVATSMVKRLKAPSRLVVPLVLLEIVISQAPMSGQLRTLMLHVGGVLLIAALVWAAVAATYVFEDVILARYRLDVEDNLKARRIHTQIVVLRRVAVVVISVVGLGMTLLTFGQIRALGTGLLASAGIVGIIVGVAAKPTATNVVAGLQIAISQPIRIDDVVVVDGHWGRVEEIALTYVVVRIWDMRRLILPISYLIENPFENWTRTGSNILGWVLLDVDYTAPVEEIRKRFEKIVSGSSNWDGKVAVLQVVNADSKTIQLRALMSSTDSAVSWNLQCEVREKLISFLQAEYPESLPKIRTHLTPSLQKYIASDEQ